ncbi:MAG: hypothetical protein IPM85_11545 [Chitinophagaceae bacterium]|nr:hypothetical protein [Chitinophagaceae bacterium]
MTTNLHQSEAAMEVLSRRGGLLIKIENRKQRFITFPVGNKTYTFDANRIFSGKG